MWWSEADTAASPLAFPVCGDAHRVELVPLPGPQAGILLSARLWVLAINPGTWFLSLDLLSLLSRLYPWLTSIGNTLWMVKPAQLGLEFWSLKGNLRNCDWESRSYSTICRKAKSLGLPPLSHNTLAWSYIFFPLEFSVWTYLSWKVPFASYSCCRHCYCPISIFTAAHLGSCNSILTILDHCLPNHLQHHRLLNLLKTQGQKSFCAQWCSIIWKIQF